MDAVVQWT